MTRWLVPFQGRAVTAEHAAAVRADVAKAPPMSREQIDLIRVLIRPRETGQPAAKPATRPGRR